MQHQENRSNPWWREAQVFWLFVLVGGIYFSRISDLNLAGEETRRAQVAAEMLWSGDWLVPHQQGKIYVTRPPMGNWAIAIVARMRGRLDAIAVRLPTLLAVLFTTLLMYGYARNFLSRTGAFLAAVSYPTMAQVLQLGRVAESEGLFTLFLSASLLVWHWGYMQKWPAWLMWSAGYILAALAGLTKGPQGIAYFMGPVWFYLLIVERNWRMLLKPAHIVGIVLGAIVIAAWQVPYTLAAGSSAGKAVWFAQASNRFDYSNLAFIAKHLLRFPLEILACTFPWSLALVQLFNRNFWRSVQGIRSEVRFLLVAVAVTFPTVWLAPHARGRYFMPLYPLIGILCGLILERCALAANNTWMNRGWRQYLLGLSGAAVVGGSIACVAAFRPDVFSNSAALAPVVAISFLILTISVAVWMAFNFRSHNERTLQISAGGLAIVLGFAYTGLLVSAQVARQPNAEAMLATVRAELPEDETLVSFGPVTHAFTYYYGKFVPRQPWPEADDDSPPEYFCCLKADLPAHPLPFAWEAIGEMSFEDDAQPSPRSYVLIARRLPELAANQNDPKPEPITRH